MLKSVTFFLVMLHFFQAFPGWEKSLTCIFPSSCCASVEHTDGSHDYEVVDASADMDYCNKSFFCIPSNKPVYDSLAPLCRFSSDLLNQLEMEMHSPPPESCILS